MRKNKIYLPLAVLALLLTACATPRIDTADLKSEINAARAGHYGQAILHAELSHEELETANTILGHIEKKHYWNINEKQKAIDAARAAARHRLDSEKEMCKWLTEVHSQNHHIKAVAEATHHTAAYFHSGSAVPFKIEDESIGQVGRWLQAHPDATATVTASADTVGKPEANLALSEKRANAIVHLLTKEGARTSQLTIKAVGEVGNTDNTPDQKRRIAVITTSHPISTSSTYIDCPKLK